MTAHLELRTALGTVSSVRTWVEVRTHVSTSSGGGIADASNPGFNLDGSVHTSRETSTTRTTSILWLDMAVRMDDGGVVPIRIRKPGFTAIAGHRLRLVHARAGNDQDWSFVAYEDLELRTIQWFDDAVSEVALEAARASSSRLLALFGRLGGPWHTVSFAACGFAIGGFMAVFLLTSLGGAFWPTYLVFFLILALAAAANEKALRILEPRMSLVCDRVLKLLRDLETAEGPPDDLGRSSPTQQGAGPTDAFASGEVGAAR